MKIEPILRKAIENNQNILLRGRHGVGKTSIVKATIESMGLKYIYLSASTCDPALDFIGIPRPEKDDAGRTVLKFYMPGKVAAADFDVLVIDEFNRGKPAMRNAVMELIQFHSVNGTKFDKLKSVITMINPDDDEEFSYDVDRLDPAQADRFQIQLDIPYDVDVDYFMTKYRHLGEAACGWWRGLEKNVQKLVTPRRLESALIWHLCKGDVRNVLPKKVSPVQFRRAVTEQARTKVKALLLARDIEAVKKLLQDELIAAEVQQDAELFAKVKPYMTDEAAAAVTARKMAEHSSDSDTITRVNEIITTITQTCDKYDSKASDIENDIYIVSQVKAMIEYFFAVVSKLRISKAAAQKNYKNMESMRDAVVRFKKQLQSLPPETEAVLTKLEQYVSARFDA